MEGFHIRKADRKMQGYNEIIAYYLDRTLGLKRKPPIVGRYLSSKLLYSYAFTNDGTVALVFFFEKLTNEKF